MNNGVKLRKPNDHIIPAFPGVRALLGPAENDKGYVECYVLAWLIGADDDPLEFAPIPYLSDNSFQGTRVGIVQPDGRVIEIGTDTEYTNAHEYGQALKELTK